MHDLKPDSRVYGKPYKLTSCLGYHITPYPEYSALCVDVRYAKHDYCSPIVVHWRRGQRSDRWVSTSTFIVLPTCVCVCVCINWRERGGGGDVPKSTPSDTFPRAIANNTAPRPLSHA